MREATMKKSDAIDQLGGSVQSAARAIGVTYQAVKKWPDVLSPRIEDRVVAALSRMNSDSQIAASHRIQPTENEHA